MVHRLRPLGRLLALGLAPLALSVSASVAAPSPQEAPPTSPPRPPGEVSIIILGGGRTPDEATAWRQKNAGALVELSKTVVLPEGHPREMTSTSVAGLNPGFQILVGGVCQPADAERVLPLINRHIPAAYIRPVKVSDEDIACPKLSAPMPMVTFHDDGRRCRILRTAPGEAPQAWGSLPGRCPETTWNTVSATRTPEGRVVVGSPAGGVERAHDGKVRELPPLQAPWSLEWVGLDLDGYVIAAGRFSGPDAGSANSRRSRWTIDGRAVEYVWDKNEQGAALCGVFSLGTTGWSRSALRPHGTPTGGAPGCPAAALGVDARIPLGRPGAGAPGKDWPPAVGGPVEGLVQLDGPFAARSSGGMLEGPVYFTGATPWKVVDGFDARGPVAVQLLDGLAIVCAPGRAAVVSLADGGVGWTAPSCPIVWDQ